MSICRHPLSLLSLGVFVLISGRRFKTRLASRLHLKVRSFKKPKLPRIYAGKCATKAKKGGNKEVFFRSRAAQEMRVGPSETAYRSRLQTALSCIGKEPVWLALRKRHS